MITLTTDQGLKITIFVKHINFFRTYQYEKINCRIWTTSHCVEVQETYEEVYDLINSALKGENQC